MIKKYRTFLKILEKHHEISAVHSSKRHLGIILTLVGFLLFAFYTILFQIDATRSEISHTLTGAFTEFSIFYFSMTISFLPFCIAKGKHYFICKAPKWILIRAAAAIICLWFYSLSRIWTDNVDNSLLYSTDALWVVVIMLIFGLKVNKLGIWGAFIGLAGIIFIYYFDFTSLHDMVGGIFGTISGISLAIIIIISRFLVTKDPPLRIGFYNGVIGFIVSSVIAFILGIINGWTMPSLSAIILMMFSGFLFSLTLFCFLEACYYTESLAIGAVSYFLPVFTESIQWVILQHRVPWTTIIGSFILIVGGLMIIISSYREDKKVHHSVNYRL